MGVSTDKVHNLQNLKYLAITAVITLTAGFAPLFLAGSPVAELVDKIAIAISVLGLATVLTMYFWQEVTTALTFREEDSRWH